MYSLAIFLPLIGALIAGFFGRSIGDRGAQLVTCGLVIAAAVISVIAFIDVGVLGNVHHADLATWISSGTFEARWALRFDACLKWKNKATMTGSIRTDSRNLRLLRAAGGNSFSA